MGAANRVTHTWSLKLPSLSQEDWDWLIHMGCWVDFDYIRDDKGLWRNGMCHVIVHTHSPDQELMLKLRYQDQISLLW